MVTESDKRDLPPVAELALVTMALVVTSGTYTAAYIPRDVPMLIPSLLTAAAAIVLAGNVLLLRRVTGFAWKTFRLVFGCSLAGYGVIAVLMSYVFIRDDIPGDVMRLLGATLVIFALNIPLLFAFSVARYQPGDTARSGDRRPRVRHRRQEEPRRRPPPRATR